MKEKDLCVNESVLISERKNKINYLLQFYSKNSRFSFWPNSQFGFWSWTIMTPCKCLSSKPLPVKWVYSVCKWMENKCSSEKQTTSCWNLPYFTCAMSPTTISATGIWITCPPRTTVNFCSCSIRLWSPRNCFSLLQSLKAVTSTTQITESRMAAPSIQPASASPSSSAPPVAVPHPAKATWRISQSSEDQVYHVYHTKNLLWNDHKVRE